MPHAHWAGQPALKLMVSSLLSWGRTSSPEQEPWKVWGTDGVGRRGGVEGAHCPRPSLSAEQRPSTNPSS